MCGGVGFRMKNLRDSQVKQLLAARQAEASFSRTGAQPGSDYVLSAFWSAHPILLIRAHDAVRVYDWGNRDKTLKLPLTGWTKLESLSAGRWDWLHPTPAVIPAEFGYEKGVWFKIEGGIRGIIVRLDGVHRAYMLTKPATDAYEKTTAHDRMPVFIKGDEAFTDPIRTGRFESGLPRLLMPHPSDSFDPKSDSHTAS